MMQAVSISSKIRFTFQFDHRFKDDKLIFELVWYPKKFAFGFQKHARNWVPPLEINVFGMICRQNHAIKINLGTLLGSISSVYRKNMCRPSEPIDNGPYGIMLLRGVWQPNHEILIYVLPFSWWLRHDKLVQLRCDSRYREETFLN